MCVCVCVLKRDVVDGANPTLELTLLLAKTGEIVKSTFYFTNYFPKFHEVGESKKGL